MHKLRSEKNPKANFPIKESRFKIKIKWGNGLYMMQLKFLISNSLITLFRSENLTKILHDLQSFNFLTLLDSLHS